MLGAIEYTSDAVKVQVKRILHGLLLDGHLGSATVFIIFLSLLGSSADYISTITNFKDQSKFLFSAKIHLWFFFHSISIFALQPIHGSYLFIERTPWLVNRDARPLVMLR